MSHRLEVGERRSLASHYTLTTVSDRLLSHRADGRLLHTVGPYNAKHRYPVDVRIGRWMHPVDAGWVTSDLFHRHAEF